MLGRSVLLLFFGVFWVLGCSGGGGSGNSSSDTISLSGTIGISGHTAVDSDVNDAWTDAPLAESNNTIQEAQSVSAPVTIGGYLTVANSSECATDGQLCEEGDTSDFYKVSLNGDWTITLYVADTLEPSLYLYDANEQQVTMTDGSTETLSMELTDLDGEYYLEVRTQDGASNYTLTIASSASTSATSSLSINEEFVPGEFLVRFKSDQSDQSGFKSVANSSFKAQNLGLSVISQSGENDGPMLVQIDENQKSQLFQTLNIKSASQSVTSDEDERRSKLETIQVIQAMRQRSDVQYADPNYIRRPLAEPNDQYYYLQWHYPAINLPAAWDEVTSATLSPVVVAVIDTGVLMDHPDLSGQLTTDGYDFISDPTTANDGDGLDDDPNDSGDELQNGSSSFHGTHVAGTIAAASNNSIGGAGVTWRTQTQIMPLRALGIDGGTSADILEAVKYAAGLENDSGLLPDQIADVINLSLGGGSYSDAENDIYEQVREQGVLVVAAAGNEATNTPTYPAAYSSVISVSAVDINSELAYYSNYGSTIDIAAPGGDNSQDLDGDTFPEGVLSCMGDDSGSEVEYRYAFSEGTSMATPHVAGVIALMKSVAPELTPDEFDAFLLSGYLTTDLGDIGRDNYFGYGLIDAYSSVLAALDGEIPLTLKTSPTSLYFGTDETTATLTAQMMGEGSLSITSVTSDASWISVTPTSGELDSDSTTDTPSTTSFQVQIERPSDFLDGIYTSTITFVTPENTVEVAVSMQKLTTDRTSDAGFHYVVLLDSETFETVNGVAVSAENGQYSFQINDVEVGTYYLVAGTDLDNDGYIGEDGEAFGMYLSSDEPTVIEVTDSVQGLDFLSGFNINLPSVLSNTSKTVDIQ